MGRLIYIVGEHFFTVASNKNNSDLFSHLLLWALILLELLWVFLKNMISIWQKMKERKTFISRELVWEVLLSILLMLSVRNNRIFCPLIRWMLMMVVVVIFLVVVLVDYIQSALSDWFFWLMVSDTLIQLCCGVVVLCGRYLHGKEETKAC